MQIPDYKSDAKRRLVEMLVALKGQDEGDFTFYVKGDVTHAETFIHRMRVELSRLRTVMKARHQPVKQFKVLCVSVTPHKKSGDEVVETKVVLRKSMKGFEVVNDIVEDVFDLFGGAKNG